MARMAPAAQRALRESWKKLNDTGPVVPAGERIVWVGHSLGAALAAKLASDSANLGLPPPGALLLVQPGGVRWVGLSDLGGLPVDTLVSIVVGDVDRVARDRGARFIMDRLAHMPASNVELVTIRTDRRSRPPLVADHFSPLSAVPSFPPAPADEVRRPRHRNRSKRLAPDALDYYGYWKLCDGLLDAVFRGRNLEYARGGTQQQRFMGRHSDGAPVVGLVVKRDADGVSQERQERVEP